MTAINLRGVWLCMTHELRQMRTQDSGAIVNCSSLGGLVGQAGRATYHAAKHGVVGLTKSAAMDYASQGIRINAVCPGVIETHERRPGREPPRGVEGDRARPTHRSSRPADEIAAVLWLCSPGASFVHGVALPVDGGRALLEGVGVDHVVIDDGDVAQQVRAVLGDGVHAQDYTVVPAELVFPPPAVADFETGASIGIPACTAHRALTVAEDGPARLKPDAFPGTTVLVSGGAGRRWQRSDPTGTVGRRQRDRHRQH